MSALVGSSVTGTFSGWRGGRHVQWCLTELAQHQNLLMAVGDDWESSIALFLASSGHGTY